MKLQEKQSIYDVTVQKFGTLDNLIDVSNDNDLSISGLFSAGTDLTINNTNLGEDDIKREILDKNLTFNNNYIPTLDVWILATGFWNDQGVWKDDEFWID